MLLAKLRSSLALLPVFALISLAAGLVQAQVPGVDMPLHSGVYPFQANADQFVAGDVPVANYLLRMERTFDPQQPNAEIQVLMLLSGPGAVAWPSTSSSGPVEYPTRARRFFKDDLFYNAVDWRAVRSGSTPKVYTQSALVSWPAGFGQYTGVWYPAGSTVIDLTITVY